MALHLLDLALQQEGGRRTAAANATTLLTLAAAASRSAQSVHTAAATALDAAEAALVAVLAQRPQTPAAMAAQSLALRQTTVAQREALATLHTEAALALSAEVTLAAARRAAHDAAAELTQAQARLAPARAAHEQRRAIIDDTLTQPPLDTLATDAAAVLAGSDFTTASARIDSASLKL